ncbi:hypothetical protein IV102_02095 [bacterium]|nr:hypothetical protein [bacterium]
MPHWGCYHDMDDEAAVAVLGATRLLGGELPYRDWTTRHTPGTYFVTAFYFLFFGSGQLGTRSLMGVISSLSGLVIFDCSRRVVQGPLAYLPWLLWICGSLVEKPALNHHWFGALSTLICLRCLMVWVEKPGPRSSQWVGVSAALSSWFLQSNGLSSLLMVLFVILRCRPVGVLRVGWSYLGTQCLLWLPWLPLAPQVWHNHVTILARHVQFNNQPYSWKYLKEWLVSLQGMDLHQQTIHCLAAWSEFGRLVAQYGMFYIVILLGLGLAERRRNRIGIVLAYACLAWALTTGYCQTIDYLSYAAPAFQLGLLALVARPWRGRNLVLGLWAGLELLGWLLRSWSIGLAFCYPVETRVGTYWALSPQEAMAHNQLHVWIEKHCPPGTQVLAHPYFTRIYTLERLQDPIPQPILVPWLFEEREFTDCVERLQRLKVPYIIHRVLSMEAIHNQYPQAPVEEFRAEYEKQFPRVFAHYHKVWAYSGYEVWAREETPP